MRDIKVSDITFLIEYVLLHYMVASRTGCEKATIRKLLSYLTSAAFYHRLSAHLAKNEDLEVVDQDLMQEITDFLSYYEE